MTPTSAEDGFTLIELVVCVALLVLGIVVALNLFATVVRHSQDGIMRDAALAVAHNAVERSMAAAAYLPADAGSSSTTQAAEVSNHGWALSATPATYNASVRINRATCSQPAPFDVALPVTVTYTQATDTLLVTVQYPPDPCDTTTLQSVALTQVLPPAQYAPGTQIVTPIDDPAVQ